MSEDQKPTPIHKRTIVLIDRAVEGIDRFLANPENPTFPLFTQDAEDAAKYLLELNYREGGRIQESVIAFNDLLEETLLTRGLGEEPEYIRKFVAERYGVPASDPDTRPDLSTPEGAELARIESIAEDGRRRLLVGTAAGIQRILQELRPLIIAGPNSQMQQAETPQTVLAEVATDPQEKSPKLIDEQSREPQSDKGLPALQDHDRQAYQLWALQGWKQQQIADELNREHGTQYGQGQVSRMINRAMRHAKASGLSDLIPKPAKPATAIDPERLELGKRIDRRSSRQRSKPDAH